MQRLLVVICLSFQMYSALVIAGTDWTLEKEEGGMQGSCKIHESGYKYCRIETVVAFTLKELVAINTDPGYLANWMDTVMHSEQIEKVSETNYVNYLQYDLPYPFRDRDSTTRTLITQDKQTKEVKMEFKTENSIKAQSIEFEPMQFIYGYWKFTPLSQYESKVEYAALVLPGGNLAPVLYNTRSMDVPWNTVNNLKKELVTDRYKKTTVNFIDNF